MDVKCERCGTEYEFEDSRVTEEGVTVKCSTCGHLFKIRKKSFVLTEPVMLGKDKSDEAGDRNWMIRRGDGTVMSFKELTTLQKWIVERKVSREDEISKSGETWKRLGTIAELASFFQVVDQADTPGPGMGPSQSPGAQTLPGVPAAMLSEQPAPAQPITQPMPAAVPSTVPPGAVPSTVPSTGQMPAAVPSAPPTTGQIPVAPMAPSVPPLTGQTPSSPAVASEPPPTQEFAPVPIQPPEGQPDAQAGPTTGQFVSQPGAEPDSWGESAHESDDVVEKWKKRGRRKWFIIVLIFLLAAGVGVWYLVSPETFMQILNRITGKGAGISEEATNRYNAGYAHYLKDSEAELAIAIQEFDGAAEAAEGKFPKAMAMLAEARIARADKLWEKAATLRTAIDELEKQIKPLMPADGSEPTGDLRKKIAPLHNKKVTLTNQRGKLLGERDQELDVAKRLIDSAQEQDAKSFEAKAALADFVRAKTGDRGRVDQVLTEARSIRKEDPALLFVEGALLAEDPDSLSAAAAKLNQALASQGDLVRARYRLARVLVAMKKPEDAKAQLDRILKEVPGHVQAKALLATLAKAPKEEPKEEKPEAPEAPGAPTTYEGWMNKGDQAQKRERYREALEAYDKALELKPGDVEALTGKGYCNLDKGSNMAAIRWFRQALKTNPRYAAAIMGIAEAFKYHGDNEKARTYYQRYLDVLPNGPEANVARRNLKELK